jgi:hypothetical protein
MKGGTARRPKPAEKERLSAVQEFYHAKEIVLFEWKRGEGCVFSTLEDNEWSKSSAKRIFG